MLQNFFCLWYYYLLGPKNWISLEKHDLLHIVYFWNCLAFFYPPLLLTKSPVYFRSTVEVAEILTTAFYFISVMCYYCVGKSPALHFSNLWLDSSAEIRDEIFCTSWDIDILRSMAKGGVTKKRDVLAF